MRTRLLARSAAAAASALLFTACADRGSPVGPLEGGDGRIRQGGGLASATQEVCEVISFNEFTHGSAVGSVSANGVTFSVTGMRWVDDAGTARAYDTNLESGIDPDLDMAELGSVLIIEDIRGFAVAGDENDGGTLTLTRTAGSAEVYFKRFTALDVDTSEPGIQLWINGALAATSPSPGNGSVTEVPTGSTANVQTAQFRLGLDDGSEGVTGSGAVDDIQVCRQETTEEPPPPPPTGGEGCTPGYWKQSHHFDSWVGYAPNQSFASVFENAFPGRTLVQVLGQGGGGLHALGRHTVAALLNASNPDVNYRWTAEQVVEMFNDVYPGTKAEYEALKNQFERENQMGCPLN